MAGKIIALIGLIILMGFFPYIAQGNCGINDSYFKRIKIKRLGFLFCGVNRESASKHGLIKSLFIIQLIGYILMILSAILVFILLFAVKVEDNMRLTLIVLSSILGAELIALVAVMAITSAISKKRAKALNYEND